MKTSELLWVMAVVALAMIGCEKEEQRVNNNGTGGTDDTDSGGVNDTDTLPPTPGCGDGVLDDDEACDDGNLDSGDGCAGNCRSVEPGWSCYPPGAACQRVAVCGDGIVVPPELCDDGNLDEGDGCNTRCQVEIGFKCDGNPSVCTPTVCGDGKMEGAETCDDGNAIPFDGCSAQCQMEPDCSQGFCTSECGDGIVLPPEECDDGNNIDGDGCSAACKVEPGYECKQEGCTDEANCTLNIAAIVRDFTAAHSDFGKSCDGLVTGMVQTTLGSNWKPVGTGLGCSVAGFSDWYTTAPAKVTEIVLFPDGNGNFVNQYGENGEQWTAPGTQPVSDQPCTGAAVGVTCLPCQYVPTQSCTVEKFDGNPLFFPIDDIGTDAKAEAKVPEQYGYNGWPWEKDVPGMTAKLHNFYFTTEVTYWFAYDENATSTLNFTGDDDVWVFVNGRLAVDLGGVHVPLDGSVTISSANSFGMEHGKVYRINVFHAERKMEGSSFKLTLGGFNTARSACMPDCGDGILGLGEECDDGVNEGGYGKCGPGCKWGERCGDGVIQEEEGEHCDDGRDNGKPDKCPTSCRFIIIH